MNETASISTPAPEQTSRANLSLTDLPRLWRVLKPMAFEHVVTCFRLLWMMSLGMAKRVNRRMMRQIGYDIGYRPTRGDLPKVPMAQARRSDVSVEVRELERDDWNVRLDELLTINSLVRQVKPQAVFEFGTFDGRTTLNIAANAPESAIINTIDLPPETTEFSSEFEVGARYRRSELAPRVNQLFGDTRQFDFQPYHQSIDFIFVDASHDYDCVLSDARHAIDMLRDGKGVILWHDYETFPGVTRALDQLRAQDERFASLVHIENTTLAMLKRT